MLLFTTAVALATGVVFSPVPALRATAAGPAVALKSGSGIAPRARTRLLPALVMLVGAGLFVWTFENLEQIDPGFRSRGVLLVNVDPRRAANPMP